MEADGVRRRMSIQRPRLRGRFRGHNCYYHAGDFVHLVKDLGFIVDPDRIPWSACVRERKSKRLAAHLVEQVYSENSAAWDRVYTPVQAGYLAHRLTLDSSSDDALTQTIAGAKVDLNPHQVEAALFALKSPLSRGVLLADEVGLGKTIEASLVLAQKWAKGQRRLLLVVPATLRKQWSQELADKFSLPSILLEARTFNEALKRGAINPFDVQGAFDSSALVIVSYEFASKQAAKLELIPWDLVVFDEAHKLRNIYKPDGAKIARSLDDALKGRNKILLSATPLQNNLQELYGLVSVIDPHFFGGLDSFKARYCRNGVTRADLEGLRARLTTVCMRTLRRQVQEEGGIKFTRRFSLTEDFTPSDDELTLYHEVSTYLQDPEILAIKRGARHLVTLVVRKILASSSRAIEGTLQTMIQRLESKLPVDEDAMADYDAVDDLLDAMGADDEGVLEPPSVDARALQTEIDRLKNFKHLAAGIVKDRKADALLRVLVRAFEMTERLGGARKAVIFTESVRTQAWLFDLLSAVPTYQGRIVLLNGSNADATSKQIYKDWIARHQGTARVSDSKTADMKAALVDRFREDASILICTEAGAEGINLQFCSLLINYDLPWNPQRVEQRIGRVHRYGQKHDVVVVNFINKGNRADERVFELLNEKFQLFEGVFGASDQILGSIESGVDIEQRINDIYQRCRDEAAIEAEFNALQETLKTELDARTKQTQRSVLDNLDADVVRRLNLRREKASDTLSQYQQHLLRLAKMLLPRAKFEGHRFFHDGFWHNVNWQEAETEDAEFFRPNEGLGQRLIAEAKAKLGAIGTTEVAFRFRSVEEGQYSDLKRFIGLSGELVVDKLTLRTSKRVWEFLLAAGMSDGGESLDQKACERMLGLPGNIVGPWSVVAEGRSVPSALDQREKVARMSVEQENARFYETESEKLERWAEDRRVALDLRIKQLDAEIREARKQVRQQVMLQDKLDAKRVLQKMERERDETMLAFHEDKKRIEAEEDRLLADVETALQIEARRETLVAIRWRLIEDDAREGGLEA